jgi:hypothetical protein
MTITIERLTQRDELLHHYAGQINPQPCSLVLDCRKETLTAAYDLLGPGVTEAEYHGHVRRYPIPCLTADAANALMEEVLPLAQRVCDGYDTRWNGSNSIATFTADARKADKELAEIAEDASGPTLQEISPDEWLQDNYDLEINADTTDEELERIANEQEEEAWACDEHYVIRNLDEHLRKLREERRTPASCRPNN